MFEKTKSTLQPCDLALARAFSEMPALEGERPIKPARLAFFLNHAKNRTYFDRVWTVVIDKTTGNRYRADGQHSSKALCELTEAEWQECFPNGLKVTIEEITTDNLHEDAFRIFDLFDNPKAARSNGDVMGLYKAQYEDVRHISNELLLRLMTGVAQDQKSLPKGKGIFREARERGLYLAKEENRNFAIWAAPFAAERHGWMLNKPGIVAEMVGHRRADSGIADNFWQLVFYESHYDPDHYTRELSRTLKEWFSKPKISQMKIRKEVAKQWRRFRLAYSAPALELNPIDQSPGGPIEATL